jgi:predicted HTH transcriptional regulator
MTSQFEVEVTAALEEFLAKVTQAAERESIEVVRSAFSRVGVPEGGSVAASAPESLHRISAHRASVPRRRTVASAGAVRALILARICEAPGITARQLGDALGLSTDEIRRYVRLLVQAGTVRTETRLTGPRGAIPRCEFFPASPGDANHIPPGGPQPDPPMFGARGAA